MMVEQMFIPYKYGLNWAIQTRRNAIIISPDSSGYDDLKIDGSIVIYNMSDLTSGSENTSSGIYIIPNITEWDIAEQKKLCRYINDHIMDSSISLSSSNRNEESKKDGVMFIGLIPDFESRFKIIDWLLHKFWICCEQRGQQDTDNDTADEQSITEPSYINPSLIQYIKDLMIHLRIHRLLIPGKGGGIHTGTLNDMILLSKLVSSHIYGRDYVVPEDVKQSLKWYIPWHMIPLKPDQWALDTSLLYGSDPVYVKQFHEIVSSVGTKPAALERLVIDDVLRKVVPPI